MFHQVMIRKEDRYAQRILWRDGDATKPMKEYEMQLMIFGSTCSPCAAHNEEEAVKKINEIIKLHEEGGFEVVSWVSNSPEVVKKFAATKSSHKDLNKSTINRILGLRWNTENDEFEYNLNFHKIQPQILQAIDVPTKRQVLSFVMSVFDPLGLLTNLTIRGRIILQQICRSGINWDDTISHCIYENWLVWLGDMKKIEEVKIPRCYSESLPFAKSLEIHVFGDASEEAFSSVAYLRMEEIVLELYNNALRAQARKEYADSQNILKQLIEENIPQLENNGGLPKSMSTLKYSCYVNLGNIYLNENNIIKALESFTNASELDSTDVTLWAKIGKLALKEDKFSKAAYAFSKGLECSESHWPCLDNLISVLYAIKDTVSCLVYIGKALMLDADYIKGLVLRKQIYTDNPATREYYKLYNPDHIWEPPLDIEIDQEEEEDILKEAQSLSKRLSEVEKVLGPKPFEIIPLPKALGECTWVALSKTVICCHKYITNNEMSHFTRFDMSKCMSQSTETEPIQSNKIVEDINIINDNKSSDNKCLESIIEVTSSVEKMETSASLVERRTSQNSEPTNGNDNPENITPIQTDNDDEQNMELENDNETDGDNQGDNIDTTNQRRKGKRKRDVLSDLQIWGWHSKRKQSKKASKDYTVQDALNRIIPKTLLKNKITVEIINQDDEDSMNTMDIYNMYVENKELNFLSPIHSPKSVNFEAYFGTDREKDDVSNFWTKERPRTDAIILVKELTIELSKLWQYKWPKELVFLYIEVFKMYREHCDQPQVFCTELTFEEISADALATLLYGELISFSSETAESIHPCILSYLQIVSNWSESGKEEFSSFFVRFYWLQSHCFRKTDENELAIKALEAILGEIDEKENKLTDRFSLSLPNCFKYGFITKQIIDKILKHLSMIISLGSIENLFNSQKYTEVAEILKQTFYSGSYPKVGRMGRPAQLGILMHSLWFTNWEECFVWTEECLNESLQNYWKPSADQDKWIKIMEKCLGIFLEIIKKETVSIIDKLSEEKRCRLVEGCAKIVCKQLNTENDACKALGCITPWLLLHYILLRDEHRQYASKRLSQSKKDQVEIQEDTPEPNEEELPPSIAILSSAHEFLGPKGWCLAGNGELLHFILDTSLDRLDTPIFEPFRDKIDIHIEQAMFCLYLYPSKKNKISRHLIDHNVNPLPLTWERSFQLYQYYAPDSLPEFNSYKNASISSDLEQLFKRIIGLVPSICALHDHLPRIMDFIHGKCDKLPEPVDFPNRVRAIYYLIGDYYFKEKEFARCIKYFQLDLCVNPTRLDSWASLALSYAAQLENTLNYCEKLKNDTDFFDKAKSAQICFKKALELDADNLVLWIECGSFEYMVHSFCSRLIKFESESFSMEKFELLESEKENYLDSSGNSLERAIALYEIDDSNEPDERWLQYYILGKIAEKKRKEPTEYLQYYLTASTLLHENKATYPEKINYNNPQHLSVEALELHYRIHASVLKYLEMHEGKEILNTLGSFFKKCLNSTAKHFGTPPPPAVQVPKPAESSTSATTNQSFQDQFLNSIKNFKDIKDVSEYADDSKDIVEKCLEDILSKVDEIIKENDLNKVILKVNDSEKIVGRAKKHSSQEKDEDLDVTIIEEDEVIMIISDSEDETSTILDQKTKTNAEVSPDTIEKNNEIEMGVDVTEHVEDVQSLLDKMMEQTMKDTEKMDDSDANNSSTEHIEEVVIKEDSLDTPDGELPEIKTNERSAETKVDKIAEPSKTKPSDSETDTENRKIADDDSSSSSSSSSSDSSSSDSDSDDSDSSSSSSSSDTSNENMSNSEILQLVDKCVQGLEICITRLPQNYKALYRLAHFLFNYKSRKDYTKCKQLLLGEYKCKDSTVITGLFSDRKTTNFFNGIWRIPSTEIDRPGSLAAHMNRCISLVLQVLRNTNDTKTLMELCMQLLKVPDRDKIYIKDSDRKAFSEQALSMCIQSFKSQIKNVLNMQNQQIVKLLHDIFRIFQRVQKHIPSKESTFSGLLTDVYRQFIKENIPDSVNVLDLAIKFCQQHRPIEKHKTSVLNPVFSRSPGVAKSPVHPTPSTFVGSQKPLKPPSLGRPRGRPPLPKLPGHVRHPRPKGSSSSSIGSYPWQNPMFGGTNFSYEYLKHYQDELIKQYSQNLSISQLNQLTQFFSAGQLNNPAVAQASQFLTQANLLNSTSGMLRPPMSNIGTSSLLDPNVAFKGFNPQLSPALANLTPDQMKFLESMLPNMSKQTSTTKLSSSGTKSSGNQYAGACKTYSSSSSKSASNSKTLVSSSKTINLDVQKLKPSTTGKPPAPVFKEPVQAKVYPSLNTSDDKAANILMKDRPNISITPVGGLSVTPVTTSHLVSKSGYSTPVTNTNITFSKTSLPKPHTTNPNISKHIPSLSTGHPLSKPSFVQTITSSNTILSKPTSLSMHHTSSSPTFSKPSHLSISHSSPSTSKHAPVAHSSTSPKPAHTLPSTPPPVSSPSFIKPGISTSPGKTLQEKLADKKKEQETKQLMKNIEAEIFSANIPSTSAALLKGLNLPNIPSSLSVSPSSTNNAISVYPANMSLELEKQQNLQKFPSAKNTGHMTGHSIERQLPSSLTVSKSVPPSVYTPRFSPDSGISISPVSPTTIKDKHKPTEKHLTLHDVGTFMPISLDQSMDISPISSKGSSNSPISPKGQTKQSSPHTVIQGLKMSNLSSKSKSKDSMSVKKDLFSKPSCSGMEISNAKSTIVDTVGSRQDFVVKKNASKFKQDGFKKGVVKPTTSDKNISKHVSSDKKALSVIKHLTSIDISPVPLTYKKTNELASKEEVICLDSDGE